MRCSYNIRTKRRHSRALRLTAAFLPICAFPIALATHAQAASYTVTALGSFGGDSFAEGISPGGQVVGYSETGGIDNSGNAALRGLLYNGSLHELGTLGGTSSVALGINSSGQTVGYSELSGDETNRGFISTGTGTLTSLGTIVGGPTDTVTGDDSEAIAINPAGEVVGNASAAGASPGNTVSHAFLYTAGSGMHDLGTLGGDNSSGDGIDSLGRVVGEADTAGGAATHAFVWVPAAPGSTTGTMVDLGALGGSFSSAEAINTVGQIAGSFTTAGGDQHAFRTGASLAPINPATDDLGTFGGSYSGATSINASGETVGYAALTGDATTHAFVFNTNTGLVDLNSLLDPSTAAGWTLLSADAVNDAGQIVGYGDLNGQASAFLLTPLASPEPSPLAVLGIGAAAVGMCIRARRQRAAL